MLQRNTPCALAVLAVALCTGCGAALDTPETPVAVEESVPGDRTPQRGDWLVLWLLADPESLNPITEACFFVGVRVGREALELGVQPADLGHDRLGFLERATGTGDRGGVLAGGSRLK